MAHLLAVDGNSLGHRAWHALRAEALGGAWVAHGMVRMLATAWSHGPFDAVVVAFDSRDSIRRELYPAYKANRPPHDPELHEQLDRSAGLLATCGFTVASVEGFEADDLLASVTRRARHLAVRTSLLSSDRDLISLVRDDVTLLRPRGTMSDVEVCDPDTVRERYGVDPPRYLDLAVLRGDASDNLPGVDGIGEKTAAKLLVSWGSIEALYAGLADLPVNLATRLREGRDAVERNLGLMSPLGDPDVDVRAAVARGLDVVRIQRALRAAGLRRAADDLRLAIERPPPPPLPPPPPDDTSGLSEPPSGPATISPRPDLALDAEQAALF
ncbi:MAG: 5'-3' exonuclease [Nitriliruptorales bacterium]